MKPTLETQVEIAQLGAAYCWYVDTADAEALNELFSPDAVFAMGSRETRGREAVVHFLTTSVRGTHVSAVPLVTLTPTGAVGVSRFVFVPAGEGSPMCGGYTDHYVQIDGRWVFARRTVSLARPPRP